VVYLIFNRDWVFSGPACGVMIRLGETIPRTSSREWSRIQAERLPRQAVRLAERR
jgi:hypothetical protein